MTNPYLPPEILDYIAHLLHDEPKSLKQCCLISKSWVPRTRRHLFADIKFRSASDLEWWKKTFPDAANSPAHHARTLLVGCPQLVTASDAEEGGWIRAFSGVAKLDLDSGAEYLNDLKDSLAPFRGFAPTLKSLRMCPTCLPCPQVFDLICSFHYLEDLSLAGRDESSENDRDSNEPQTGVPSTSPSLTGTLDLAIIRGVGGTARRLLNFPNCLHFRKFTCLWDHKEDPEWITELVVKCSQTLESLDITYTHHCTFVCICVRADSLILLLAGPEPVSLNLSRATELRDLVFRPESKIVEWITRTLQTITPEHRDLRQISVYVPHHLTLFRVGANVRQYLGEASCGWWSNLDHLLVQFWEVRSIRPKVGRTSPEKRKNMEFFIGCLLPEITKRGIVDPV